MATKSCRLVNVAIIVVSSCRRRRRHRRCCRRRRCRCRRHHRCIKLLYIIRLQRTKKFDSAREGFGAEKKSPPWKKSSVLKMKRTRPK